MNRHSIAALLAFVCVSFVSAQQRPNFGGTWIGVSPAENAGNQQVVTHTEVLVGIARKGADLVGSGRLTAESMPERLREVCLSSGTG